MDYYDNMKQIEHKATAMAYDEGRRDAYADIEGRIIKDHAKSGVISANRTGKRKSEK
jgi:hypothetical protein